MTACAVARTLARLIACEDDLAACEAVSGSRAAALRYIGLARRMLEPAAVFAGRAEPGLPHGIIAQDSLDGLQAHG